MANERPDRSIAFPCPGLFDGFHATPDESETGPIFLRIDTLLPKLISGKLRLLDAERIVERMM